MSDENVKDFVRNTLGCDCAEEVFSHIENEAGAEAGGIRLKNKINVGDRLLVYIVDAEGDTVGKMPALVAAGKAERDARGFNRFRLVLVSDDREIMKRGFEAYRAMGISDERIHLHVIEKRGAKSL